MSPAEALPLVSMGMLVCFGIGVEIGVRIGRLLERDDHSGASE